METGHIERVVLDALPAPFESGDGVSIRDLATVTGRSRRQVSEALRRLRNKRLAFCFDRGEVGEGRWERAR